MVARMGNEISLSTYNGEIVSVTERDGQTVTIERLIIVRDLSRPFFVPIRKLKKLTKSELKVVTMLLDRWNR